MAAAAISNAVSFSEESAIMALRARDRMWPCGARTLSVDDLEREAIEAARTRPAAERLRDGLRLFDRTCRVMFAGIRHEHPERQGPGKSCGYFANDCDLRDR